MGKGKIGGAMIMSGDRAPIPRTPEQYFTGVSAALDVMSFTLMSTLVETRVIPVFVSRLASLKSLLDRQPKDSLPRRVAKDELSVRLAELQQHALTLQGAMKKIDVAENNTGDAKRGCVRETKVVPLREGTFNRTMADSVLNLTFSFLKTHDKLQAGVVCRRWKTISSLSTVEDPVCLFSVRKGYVLNPGFFRVPLTLRELNHAKRRFSKLDRSSEKTMASLNRLLHCPSEPEYVKKQRDFEACVENMTEDHFALRK